MEYRNGEYYLSNEESDILFRQSIHPDEVIMERRNRFFAEMDESLQINYSENGEITFEVPDFEISDLSKPLTESFPLDMDESPQINWSENGEITFEVPDFEISDLSKPLTESFPLDMDESPRVAYSGKNMIVEAPGFEVSDLLKSLTRSFPLDKDTFFCRAYSFEHSYTIVTQNSCIGEAA